MNNKTSIEDLGGKKFLYQKPELLTEQDHGALGITPSKHPFAHVRDERAIPLTTIEFASAQRHYPIVFSSLENPAPLAVVGLADGPNLFVDGSGQWDPECYIPSYLRCYPLAFATDESGRMAVVVDRAATSVTENPEFPFFVDGAVSKPTDDLMQFCSVYDAERKSTQEFCNKLVELDLLAPLRATYAVNDGADVKTLATYIGINIDRLNALESETVYELHKSGLLSAIYLQIYSLESWRYLRARSAKLAESR